MRRGKGVHGERLIRLLVAACVLIGAATVACQVLLRSAAHAQSPAAIAQATPPLEFRGARSRLRWTACWFAVPAGADARCFHLHVPEQPDGISRIERRLAGVVFKARGPSPAPDPIVMLVGGPGQPAGINEPAIQQWWQRIDRTPWMRERDLVVFDVRGVPMSEPDMRCPELVRAGRRVFAERLPADESRKTWVDATISCHDRLLAAGIDVSAYNVSSIATDLGDLMVVLDRPSWNLFATSFGTRVLLAYLKKRNPRVRSVILDSPHPAGAKSYASAGRNLRAVLATLFGYCDRDRLCRSSAPNLAGAFERVVRRLSEQPVVLTLARRNSEEAIEVSIDHTKFIEMIYYAFYSWKDIQRLPMTIAALDRGDARPLRSLAEAALRFYDWGDLSHGLYLSVECHDEYPFNSAADVAAAAAEAPLYSSFLENSLPLLACPEWNTGSGGSPADYRDLVGSSVPVLILGGDLDPVTPLASARTLGASSPAARVVAFPGIGHGVANSHACADLVIERFLRDPSRQPVHDCLLALGSPQFPFSPE